MHADSMHADSMHADWYSMHTDSMHQCTQTQCTQTSTQCTQTQCASDLSDLQAQTAESIVVGELLSSVMVVALNKTDLLPQEKRMKHLRRAGRHVLDALALTRFADSAIVPVAAKVGGADGVTEGVADLKDMLLQRLPFIKRLTDAPFLFAVDHCFAIKGQGTVLTGAHARVGCRVY